MISSDAEIDIQSNIQKRITKDDPFAGTFLMGLPLVSYTNRGIIGEIIFDNYIKDNTNFNIQPRLNSEHDRLINGIKLEVKICFANEGAIVYNPVVLTKDWDIIVFIFAKPDNLEPNGILLKFWYCTKNEASDFILDNNQSFWRLTKQSDQTYMVGSSMQKMDGCYLFKDFSQWNGKLADQGILSKLNFD